jgi:hypothetical protein
MSARYSKSPIGGCFQAVLAEGTRGFLGFAYFSQGKAVPR